MTAWQKEYLDFVDYSGKANDVGNFMYKYKKYPIG